jgi:hypothetical protein
MNPQQPRPLFLNDVLCAPELLGGLERAVSAQRFPEPRGAAFLERQTAAGVSSLQHFGRFIGLLAAARIGTGLLVCATPTATRLRPDVWAVPWWEL